MTKQEYADLFNSLYYGHDAELKIAGQHYFVEWNTSGIDIYEMVNGNGTKIASINGKDRNDALSKLFAFTIIENYNLNDSFSDIEIVDIE